MKLTSFQCTVAGSVAMLALFWMRAILIYPLLIFLVVVCSWLLGLLLYLQYSKVPPPVRDCSSSMSGDKSTLLYSIMECRRSVERELEKSGLSHGLSEAVEDLMQLIVRDCVIVYLHDVTTDHSRIEQLLMSVKYKKLSYRRETALQH